LRKRRIIFVKYCQHAGGEADTVFALISLINTNYKIIVEIFTCENS